MVSIAREDIEAAATLGMAEGRAHGCSLFRSHSAHTSGREKYADTSLSPHYQGCAPQGHRPQDMRLFSPGSLLPCCGESQTLGGKSVPVSRRMLG